MTNEQFWVILGMLGIIAYMLERIEKRLLHLMRMVKYGKDSE